MKIQNMAIIFIIIILPITLLLSSYTKTQIDAISLQTQYATKLRDATYDGVTAFQLNTADNKYSSVSDSMRRDIKAAVQTFISSLAKNFGMSGATEANIKPYIPAVVFTLYDGYYIYAPAFFYADLNSENEEELKSDSDYSQTKGEWGYYKDDYGEYILDENGNKIREFIIDEQARNFTTEQVIESLENPHEKFEHVLKPFIYYTARYVNENTDTDVIINYSLDNYMVVYGKINGVETTNAGYLELRKKVDYTINAAEKLYRRYPVTTILHTEDENKSNIKKAVLGERLMDVCVTGVDLLYDRYTNSSSKWVRLPDRRMKDFQGELIFNEVNSFPPRYSINQEQFNNVYSLYSNKEGIKSGIEYTTGWYVGVSDNNDNSTDYYVDPYSAAEYYDEAHEFTKWVDKYLGGIKASDAKTPSGESYKIIDDGLIFNFFNDENGQDPIDKNDPTNDESIFNEHKREVIKTSIEDNLQQAITTYNEHSGALKTEYNFKMPILSETEWDKVLKNVCMMTFVQGLQAGTKIYNDYAIVTSTKNKEYVSPDEIYFINEYNDGTWDSGIGDGKYHRLGCSQLRDNEYIKGYKSSDFDKQSYEYEDFERDEKTGEKEKNSENNETNEKAKEDKVKYYSLHQYEACYYCIVNSTDKVKEDKLSDESNKKKAYEKVLAREKYNFYKANTYLRERKADYSNMKGANKFSQKNYTLDNVTREGETIKLEVRVPYDDPIREINYKPNIENLNKYPLVIILDDSNINWNVTSILNKFRDNDFAICMFTPGSDEYRTKSELKYVVYYMSQKDYVDKNNIFIIGANASANEMAESVHEYEQKVKAIVMISPNFKPTSADESWQNILAFKKSVLLITGSGETLRENEYSYAERRYNSISREKNYNYGDYTQVNNVLSAIISDNGTKGILSFLNKQRRSSRLIKQKDELCN